MRLAFTPDKMGCHVTAHNIATGLTDSLVRNVWVVIACGDWSYVHNRQGGSGYTD